VSGQVHVQASLPRWLRGTDPAGNRTPKPDIPAHPTNNTGPAFTLPACRAIHKQWRLVCRLTGATASLEPCNPHSAPPQSKDNTEGKEGKHLCPAPDWNLNLYRPETALPRCLQSTHQSSLCITYVQRLSLQFYSNVIQEDTFLNQPPLISKSILE
jgi:hypothetical protein